MGSLRLKKSDSALLSTLAQEELEKVVRRSSLHKILPKDSPTGKKVLFGRSKSKRKIETENKENEFSNLSPGSAKKVSNAI
jgi:hypothetical protein